MRGSEAAAIMTDQTAPTELVDDRPQRLWERLRAEFVAGAEEASLDRVGRPLTREEMERALGRFPGDL